MNIRSEYSLIGIGAGIGWALACWRFWREREAVLDRLAGARRFALVQQSVNESLMDALRRGGERRATWPNDAASIRAGIPWPDPPRRPDMPEPPRHELMRALEVERRQFDFEE